MHKKDDTMLGVILAMLGGFTYYSRSKYFPEAYKTIKPQIPLWLGNAFLIAVIAICIYRYGTGLGLLMSAIIVPTAYCLLAFVLNLARGYAIMVSSLLVFFLLLDILF